MTNINDLDKIIRIESGTWASDEEIITQVLDELKEKKLYKPDLIYRVISVSGTKSKALELYKKGGYKKSKDLEPNHFWADPEYQLLQNFENADGKMAEFCYFAIYKPNKITNAMSSVYKFNNPTDKSTALQTLVELKLEDNFL
jgi:hypothetical protein